MPAQPSQELSGWKEIASHLGVGVRTAQDYEKNLLLPVRRQPGEKGRVFADPDELDAWRRQTSGDVIPARNVDAAAQTQPPISARKIWFRGFATAVVLAVVLLVSGAYLWLIPHGPPSEFRVEGKHLIVLNDRGKELWRHTFDVALQEDMYLPRSERRLGWLGQLDGGGEPDLLFVARQINDGDVGSRLFCFTARGRTKWQFTPGRPVTNGGGERFVPPYMTSALQVIVGKTPAETRIVVTSVHHLREPNQVAFLDVRGRVVGEYWHPGHLSFLGVADLGRRNRMDLVLGGVNNGSHQATLVVLDPLKVAGLMTPKEMRDHRFELLGMPPATEEAVVFFPRSIFSAGRPYTRVKHLRVTRERLIVYVAEGEAESAHQVLMYELDYGLNLVNLESLGSEALYEYQALEARGLVDHPFSEEIERLKAGVVVRRAGQR